MRLFKKLIIVFLLWAVCLFQTASAFEQREIELESVSINTSIYPGEGKILLLWLPSERGMRGAYQPVAMDLSALGIDVWAVDLHKSYMVPESRNSLDEFDREELLPLLTYAEQQGFAEIYFFAAGRGAVLALELARLWQESRPDSDLLKGYVFSTPHLLASSPLPGDKAQYKSVARQTILPVYLIQPEYSTKYARSREIANVLGEGGSQVYTHLLKGITGGYFMRLESDLEEIDLQAKSRLPGVVENAISLMRRADVPERKYALRSVPDIPDRRSEYREQTLHPYRGDSNPAPLQLKSLYGGVKRLQDYRGKLVLLNFWASWCGPCAEEIPSLSRLVEIMKDRNFVVLTVNIGEEKQDIVDFIKDLPVNFEILLDRNGDAVRDWNVYAYPTNFLLSPQGEITHAYRGALEWDSEAVISLVEEQLSIGNRP